MLIFDEFMQSLAADATGKDVKAVDRFLSGKRHLVIDMDDDLSPVEIAVANRLLFENIPWKERRWWAERVTVIDDDAETVNGTKAEWMKWTCAVCKTSEIRSALTAFIIEQNEDTSFIKAPVCLACVIEKRLSFFPTEGRA